MAPTRKPLGKRPGKRESRRREFRRVVMASVMLAGLFALAYQVGARLPIWSMPDAAVAPAVSQSDDALTNGAIVFVPTFGNTCRQNLIDNGTWEVRENGTMPCNEALAGPPHRRSAGSSATRLDIIRESFRKSP